MSADIYIRFPFGVDSDALTEFPMAADPDGAVSFEDGYTPPYQQNLNTTPGALAINRGQMNYLFYVLSLANQQYQQVGTPNWIDSTANGGAPFPYQINARVIYGDVIYESRVNSNTTTPGASADWVVISGSVDGIQVGMSIPWNSIGSPTGRYLLEDGSAVSRVTYADLYEKLCPINNGTTENASDLITNLDNTTIEYHVGMKLEGTGIPVGATIIAIPSASSVQMSSVATATGDNVDIRFFVWGNGDGSTTFNIPTSTDNYIAGAGGSGISWSGNTYSKVGQSFGESTYQLVKDNLPEHTHNFVTKNGNPTYTGEKVDAAGVAGAINVGTSADSPNTAGITGGTTNTPIPQIPPTKMKKWFIRY